MIRESLLRHDSRYIRYVVSHQDKKMKEEIIQHINQLEKEQGVTILLAVESGSRAWGCPSPDSDYDVRIIYKRPKSEYLDIDDKPDTINYFHGELLDINGWDIKKTLKLIRKSNATPFEWAQSPIIYKEVNEFSSTILNLCKDYFQPRHTVNHYKGIAKNSYLSNDLAGKIKLKKLFYVLRPLMAAKWIIKKSQIPPMDIPNLISIIEEKDIVNHINGLLEIKSAANEDYVHIMDKQIVDFIDQEFNYVNSILIEGATEVPSTEELNSKFRQIIED